MAESTIGIYKSELVWQQGPWRSAEQLELATLLYLEWFNNRRIHGEIGDHTPAEHENIHYRQQQPQPAEL